jgi:hypothetical protein
MRRLIACALALAALGLAASALADPPAPPKPPPTPRLFISPSGEPFRLGPTDPDPLKAWFDQADSAHLGYIDRAAFRADAARFFKQLDENGDGIVDGFEVADYEAKLVPEITQYADGRYPTQPGLAQGPSPETPPQDAAGSGAAKPPAPRRPRQPPQIVAQLIDEPEPVSGADLNLDSHITLAEWMRATDARFDLLDKAHTGRLTLDALRTILNASLKPSRR